jgi:hypothetical protein
MEPRKLIITKKSEPYCPEGYTVKQHIPLEFFSGDSLICYSSCTANAHLGDPEWTGINLLREINVIYKEDTFAFANSLFLPFMFERQDQMPPYYKNYEELAFPGTIFLNDKQERCCLTLHWDHELQVWQQDMKDMNVHWSHKIAALILGPKGSEESKLSYYEKDEVLHCTECHSLVRAASKWHLFCPTCKTTDNSSAVITYVMSCTHCDKPLSIHFNHDRGTVYGRCYTDGCGDCYSMQDLTLIPIKEAIPEF